MAFQSPELMLRLSKRTVRHCHWQLHGALELAVKWGQIPANGRPSLRAASRS